MMRTLIQKALNPQLGDRMIFSNQRAVMTGESPPSNPTKRKIVKIKEKTNGIDMLYSLYSGRSTLPLGRMDMLNSFSPDLNIKDRRLNKVQKAIVYLAYHGIIDESQELLVQVGV